MGQNVSALDEARRIIAQPVTDRLDGKQGEEARAVAVRLLESAGLEWTDAIALLETYGWQQFLRGSRTAQQAVTDTRIFTTKEN